ncbi:RNA-binding protein squid-like isoform X2 [Contarinia nasturtii]|uniref:RNA-binding protein squid-like isoform X2 n=1 Tax=Contarinia nasturtii TaxID=265458 RepID=UPI0012D4C018|nr:RNA-binding protein squid-like isoform X2 [Contarinia nasturtii]
MANNQYLQEGFSQDVKDDQYFIGNDVASENGNLHGTENGNDGQNAEGQSQQVGTPSGRNDDRELFVGGLRENGFGNIIETENRLQEYFGQYGCIERIKVPEDPIKKGPRGFAYIVFNSAEAIERAVNISVHIINGQFIYVKKAEDHPCSIQVLCHTRCVDIEIFFDLDEICEISCRRVAGMNWLFQFNLGSEQVADELLKNDNIYGNEVVMTKSSCAPAENGSPVGSLNISEEGSSPPGHIIRSVSPASPASSGEMLINYGSV